MAKLVQELASSSPEVTATPDTTSTAEAAPTPTADRIPKMVALGELPTVEQLFSSINVEFIITFSIKMRKEIG